MKFDPVSYTGPAIDDPDLLARLPKPLAKLLGETNGFIAFKGGLHVRGVCTDPDWHSLREALLGDHAFHLLYPEVSPDDVPFAEDSLGDQFLLRDGVVWRLFAETGEVESLEMNFTQFLDAVQKDPVEELGLEPLMQFHADGGSLKPGQLLSASPPFCSEEADDGQSFSAMSSDERHRVLAEFAAKFQEEADDDFD